MLNYKKEVCEDLKKLKGAVKKMKKSYKVWYALPADEKNEKLFNGMGNFFEGIIHNWYVILWVANIICFFTGMIPGVFVLSIAIIMYDNDRKKKENIKLHAKEVANHMRKEEKKNIIIT